MRPIKFRAWDKERKEMSHNPALIFDDTFGTYRIHGALASNLPVLMQYTGLKDKNSKEIYEGDILKIGNDLVEVKWIEVGNWMGEKQPMVGFISHGTIYKDSPIEVIGNIYENPELLEANETKE